MGWSEHLNILLAAETSANNSVYIAVYWLIVSTDIQVIYRLMKMQGRSSLMMILSLYFAGGGGVRMAETEKIGPFGRHNL